ncbi:GNAT family N-acetyltransferase [Albibacterium bauzanense]|uniref:RimJ/RimL family protein N-acetyltransferase n=1 Tax=Albibacterium bauzanense TaxID=653929 RepID=A0A4R1M061_9SPHI|nr:GNAT family protein [Albibacterium bauzanense]TCK85256.1 RimJ/RimL family protein N-acetyltransferase [Albibacterium bauzanense]
MIELLAFEEKDFGRLISWIKNKEEMIQFAGPVFTYPLTREQLLKYVGDSARQVFKVRLMSTGEIIGHCELNLQNEIPRLSRILIGDRSVRNQGIGKAIIKNLLSRVFTTTEFENVDLTVFDWNHNAIASYKSVGFEVNPGFETYMEVNGKIWTACNMIISKQKYQLLRDHI